MEKHLDGKTIKLVEGDITTARVDAIVNAANQWLAGGGGVDGAIHRAGGPGIMQECRRLGGCPTGDAAATGAGRLQAKHVIHAVAPIWRGGRQGEADLLRSAYRRSLEVAEELGDRTVAFPSLGTGAYGYPLDQAARIALETASTYLGGATRIEEVTFYLFGQEASRQFRAALGDL